MKNFKIIRAAILSAVLIFQTAMIPVAHAENQATDFETHLAEFNSKAAPVLASVDSEGWTVLDTNQGKISATDLLNPDLVASTREITLISPSTEDDLKVTISREFSDGKFTQKFVAMNLAGKVLGRRSFQVSDQEKDAAKVKLLFDQTLNNLEHEVEFKKSDVGFLRKFASKLAASFGIKPAHAAPSFRAFAAVESISALCLALGLLDLAFKSAAGTAKLGPVRAAFLVALLAVFAASTVGVIATRPQ